MNIRQLEYFAAVSETLNFTQAAKRFYISQTAVTQQIKSLEQEINVTLFHRNKRHVELTPAGKVFLVTVRDILNSLDGAISRCQSIDQGMTGTLTLGIVRDYIDLALVDMLDAFCRQYPNISLHFIRDAVTPLYNRLLNHEADVIINIRFDKDTPESIQYLPLHEASIRVFMSNNHLLARKNSLSLQELTQENILLLDTQSRDGEDREQMLRDLGLDQPIPGSIHFTQDIETMYLVAAANQGVALAPDYAPTLQQFQDKIRIISLTTPKKCIKIAALWNKENDNPSLPYLLDMLKVVHPSERPEVRMAK